MSMSKEDRVAKLTDSYHFRGKTAKNRIVFLPCVTFSLHGDGDDYYGSQHIAHYTKAAEGGAGIIYVQGTSALGCLSGSAQWTPGSRKTLAKIVEIIHSQDALAFIQLSWGGDRETDLNALTTEEVYEKQKDLLEAALIVHELGFDGVEFHFGHSFLLCKLFDADANKRTDRFGGGLENRMNVITDILPEIRAKIADDFILDIRMGAYLPDLETGLTTAKYLEKAGIDLLNITFSMVQPLPAPADFPLSDMAYGGSLIKKAVDIPVIGVGEIRSRKAAETLLASGYADFVGVARGILADPAFPKKILADELFFECVGCKRCFWFTDHTKCPARMQASRL